MIPSIANALWLGGCLPERARFRRATSRVRLEQERVLLRLLRDNAETEFGRRYRFGAIASVRQYQDAVPLLEYEEYRPWIDRAAGGVPNVLTAEAIRVLEPTSGSAGATKLIPYTASLQREFQNGIRPWIADLFLRNPDLRSGPAYWSVSPALAGQRRTAGGIPIGFEDDSHYVGGWQRRLVRSVMAAPPLGAEARSAKTAELRNVSDMERFRYLTLLSLVRTAKLRLISVWNPTFLTMLLDCLPEHGDSLARDLHDARRARVLRIALRVATPAERHAILWPHLGLISCWTDAYAAGPAAQLAALLPHAAMQGKGLIATEGFISFPIGGYDGSVLSVRSHFFEFLPVDGDGHTDAGTPRLADELECGQRYVVVLSTGGGLYRYLLQDVVDVVGHVNGCPLIRFEGRQAVSDWFGEKLNDAFVARVLRDAFHDEALSPSFAMLACDPALTPPAYVLYIESSAPGEVLESVAKRIENDLRRSFHYDYARRLGQLASVRVFRAERAGESYLAAAVRAGRRAGDVKPVALSRAAGWSDVFRGAGIFSAAGCQVGACSASGLPPRLRERRC